jgi:hypothetical protein
MARITMKASTIHTMVRRLTASSPPPAKRKENYTALVINSPQYIPRRMHRVCMGTVPPTLGVQRSTESADSRQVVPPLHGFCAMLI